MKSKIKCLKCRKQSKMLRRGLCLRCYRLMTGFSRGDYRIFNLEKEIYLIKVRLEILETKFRVIKEDFNK